jgi:hypothetical protein
MTTASTFYNILLNHQRTPLTLATQGITHYLSSFFNSFLFSLSSSSFSKYLIFSRKAACSIKRRTCLLRTIQYNKIYIRQQINSPIFKNSPSHLDGSFRIVITILWTFSLPLIAIRLHRGLLLACRRHWS